MAAVAVGDASPRSMPGESVTERGTRTHSPGNEEVDMKAWIGIGCAVWLAGCMSGDERVSLGDDSADGDADMDADGGGDCNFQTQYCNAFTGWYWDGDSCEQGCCGPAGVDCSPGYGSIDECQADCPADPEGGEACDQFCEWYDTECGEPTGTCPQQCTSGSCLESCLLAQGGCACSAECGF